MTLRSAIARLGAATDYLLTLPTTDDEASPAAGTIVTTLGADLMQLDALVAQLERENPKHGSPQGADDYNTGAAIKAAPLTDEEG